MASSPQGGVAFHDTLLAKGRGAAQHLPEGGPPGDPPAPARSLADALQALPLSIQGAWVGMVCIVLLVVSAAALRSLFGGNVELAPEAPVPVTSSSGLATSPPPPSGSATGVAALPSAAATPTSLSIGSASGGSGVGGFGVLAIRDRLSGHVRLRKFGAFLDDLEKLLDAEPTAIDRPDVRKMVADVATYAMTPTLAGTMSPDGERVFTFLTGRAGAAGPDILFDLVTTRGGSRAASYAEEMLQRPEVRAKGTPAFNIAYDLRAATTCQVRMALMERVKSDGDKRVLGSLFQMARCGKGPVDCCLANDPGYKEAIRIINAKR
jgi:hypothetical protein